MDIFSNRAPTNGSHASVLENSSEFLNRRIIRSGSPSHAKDQDHQNLDFHAFI